MPRLIFWIFLMIPGVVSGKEAAVLIDGTGCRTRQQAIQRIFEKLPEIDEVIILPRRDAPADNQRIFIIQTTGEIPTKERLIEALGRKAKYYQVLSVTPLEAIFEEGD